MVIQFDVDEKLVQAVGAQAIREFIDRQLSLLRLEYLGEKISSTVRRSGIDHPAEFEAAREEAWQEYKEKFLPS